MWFSVRSLGSVALAALTTGACGGAEGSDAGSTDTSTAVTTGPTPTTSNGVTAATSDATSDATTDATTTTSDATTTDATTSDATTDTGEPDTTSGGEPGSRCEQTPTTIVCAKVTVELGPWQRDVHYQVPLGEPPPGGWPAVLMFQGSFFTAEVTWVASDDLPFGAFYQTHVVKRLLDHGYAVITPETRLGGATFWDTNVPPYSLNWESSEDHQLMLEIFKVMGEGAFGPIDAGRLFATGISSGGYMTSRMVVSYPGKFRALAIAAASYATCSGPLCSVPDLDDTHLPTLFLHGEDDLTVPLSTAKEYYDELIDSGVDARLVTAPGEGHGWIPASPDEVLTWFDGHP